MENDFKWITGEPFIYSNWCAREPSNNIDPSFPAGEDHVHYQRIGGDWAWNDVINSETMGYIAEFDAGPVPEPTTVALWSALGIGLVVGHRRRKRKAAAH